MEGNVRRLEVLIEALSHSGTNSLDEDIFKEIKKICKSSQSYIPYAYECVLEQLQKKNSQIRLLAFQICKELFSRSHLFRDFVVKDLQLILDLTTECNGEKKLPPPISSANSLKKLALSTFQLWAKEFGDAYRKLKINCEFIKKCKNINFEEQSVPSVESVQQQHQRLINEEKIKKILHEFNSSKPDITETITSLSNCLSLLLPPAEDFFIPEHNLENSDTLPSESQISKNTSDTPKKGSASKKDGDDEENYYLNQRNNLRDFGVPLDYNLTLHLNPDEKIKIDRTEENSVIIDNAKDCIRLINHKFLPKVKKWIKLYCKHADRNASNVKQIIDLKQELDNVLQKSKLLNIEESNCSDESTSDDDFEEVKKDGYEEQAESLEEVEALSKLFSFKETQKESSSSTSSPKNDSKGTSFCGPSTSGESSSTDSKLSRKRKLLSIAPKLPYDVDLYHWEDEDLKTPTLLSTKVDVDKFWGSYGSDDLHEIPNPEGLSALRTRVIEFSGKFEPVKWACRAPLQNGKLCPRRDRFKCPFHGKIVARDETGNIQNKEDQKALASTAGESSTSGWQDPELLRDVEAATGINLQLPQKNVKKKKNLTHKKMKTTDLSLKILKNKNLPGLVDVVRKQQNAYTRLSKKIFNRRAELRVAAVLNKLDRNKFRDKYGDQFNYF